MVRSSKFSTDEEAEVAPAVSEEPTAKPEVKTNERPYVVASGVICPLGNTASAKRMYGERARLYKMGEVVLLTPAMARHYVRQKLLEPHIPDDDD